MNKLRETEASSAAEKDTLSNKLSRLQLQLDGAQTKLKESERLADDLQRTNADLSRQLERWQTLEGKEEEAANVERKQRVALERELRALKDKMAEEAETAREETERLQSKNQKLKASLEEWKVRTFATIFLTPADHSEATFYILRAGSR